MRHGVGIASVEELVDLQSGEIGGEAGERIAQILRDLANHGGAGHHPRRRS